MYPTKDKFRISQGFGVKNCSWYGNFPNCGHPGIDFACPEGTAILATFDGDIYKSEFYGENSSGNKLGKGYGNLVVIRARDIANTILYVYSGHLSVRNVKTGDRVRAGDLIGLSGTTGLSTAPHLHYEIRRGVNSTQNVIDPTPYLNQQIQNDILKEINMTYEELIKELEKDKFVKKDERFCYYENGKPVIVDHNLQYFPDLGDMGAIYMKFARLIREVEKSYPITKDRKEVLR